MVPRHVHAAGGVPPNEAADPDLEEAAAIFLLGPLRSTGRDAAAPDIAGQAVAQVARTLAACSPASIRDIKQAVARFRREPSLWARDSVIEAVTGAAAHLPMTTKGNT